MQAQGRGDQCPSKGDIDGGRDTEQSADRSEDILVSAQDTDTHHRSVYINLGAGIVGSGGLRL